MDNFIPSENLDGVEQLKRSAVTATKNVARLRSELETEPDELTRFRLLKLLLHEAEKSRVTHQQLDRIDCHMASYAPFRSDGAPFASARIPVRQFPMNTQSVWLAVREPTAVVYFEDS
jgi:hypothetical protein